MVFDWLRNIAVGFEAVMRMLAFFNPKPGRPPSD